MESFHQLLLAREVSARRGVSARPFIGDFSSSWDGQTGAGVHMFSAAALPTPDEQLPFKVAFAEERCSGNLVAAAGEGGCVQLFDTSKPSPEYPNLHGTGSAIDTWQAHSNSIFDIAWLQNDTHLVTASGDQVVRLWNLEAQRCVKELRGHQGSIKSVCVQSAQNNCLASGGRDGAIMLWDLRTAVRAQRPSGRVYSRCDPVATITNAHPSPMVAPRRRRSKDAAAGVTSVLYLKDDTIIASSGHADGVIRYWDTRKLHAPLVQTPQLMSAESPETPSRIHGIVCLAQDSTGGRLIASARNNHIYMYDALSPERGPFQSFTGHQSQSFYTKATFSPDDSHILSGSTDNHVYIWEADRPQSGPFVLEGHVGEVTGVDWCKTDFTKLATCSDDCTVRVWTINRSQEGHDGRAKSAAMRKRVYSTRPRPALPSFTGINSRKPPPETLCARAPEADVVGIGGENLPRGCGPGELESAVAADDSAGLSGRFVEPGAELGGQMDPGMLPGRSSEKLSREEDLGTGAEAAEVVGPQSIGLMHESVCAELMDERREAGSREEMGRRSEGAETEVIDGTPEKAAFRTLAGGDCPNPGSCPTTPVTGEGAEDGRLGLNPGPSPQFAFWAGGARLKVTQENLVKSPAASRASAHVSPSLKAEDETGSKRKAERLGKDVSERLIERPPLSPTQLNVKSRVAPRKLLGFPLGNPFDQQENVSPMGGVKAAGAMGNGRLESPSSRVISPPASSRKKQRTIIDYFKNP